MIDIDWLRRLGQGVHDRSALVGPGVTTMRTFHIKATPTLPNVTVGYTWIRPFSSRRWSVRDPWDSLDPNIAELWFVDP